MKQINLRNTVQNSNQQSIKDAFALDYQSNKRVASPKAIPEPSLLRRNRTEALESCGPNIFLTQNKGKGPPGRQRSPGAESLPEHPPNGEANEDASPLSFGREGPARLPARQGVSQNRFQFIHTKYSFFNKYSNSIFIYN
jgi:hypothetical protein